MSARRDDAGGTPPRDARRLLVLLRARVRQGAGRVRLAVGPVLLAAVAAAAAWTLAHDVVGHTDPFFAPVAAWVCLGFSSGRSVRRVAELALGVSLGVAFGETVAQLIGSGAPQIALVLAGSTLIARFVDRADLTAVQAGVQGIVIVALPVAAADGAVGRWVDALIGSAVALLLAVATPRDARRRSRALARAGMAELATLLNLLARGIRTGDVELVRDALAQARGTQRMLDEWTTVSRNATQNARLSPTSRRYVGELTELERAAVFADRAVRNARVITRQGLTAVTHGRHDDEIAHHLERAAQAAQLLAHALGSGGDTAAAREELRAIARRLGPDRFSAEGWRLQAIVILLRSLTVDLLEAAGVPSAVAQAELPPEGDVPPADLPRPS